MTPTLDSCGRLNHAVGLYSDSFPLYLPKMDAVHEISVLPPSLFTSVSLDSVQLEHDLVFLRCILSLCSFVVDFVVEGLNIFSFPPFFWCSEAVDLDAVDADVEKHLEERVALDVLNNNNKVSVNFNNRKKW